LKKEFFSEKMRRKPKGATLRKEVAYECHNTRKNPRLIEEFTDIGDPHFTSDGD
jgi:hypothetical protein